LGRHRKPSSIRLPRRLPGTTPALAAAPAVAGMAAAFLSPQAFASTPGADTTAYTVAVTTSAYQPGAPLAEQPVTRLLADQLVFRPVTKQASARKAAASQTVWYTVRSGDSLSTIAARVYNQADAWPVLYWANKSQLQSADMITPGQRLRVPPKPANIPAAPAAPAPVAAAPAAAAPAAQPVAAAPVQQAASVQTGASSGSFAACVIARESGGNAQIMNATGHYGLYQFSASTWAAYGGNPADFGNASVAEQNQVFNNAIAAGGQSNWSPYDGC
jgi:LysM repeat protein